MGSFRDLIHQHNVKKDITIKIDSCEIVRRNPFSPEINVEGSLELIFHYRPIRQEIILTDIKLDFPELQAKLEIERNKSYDSDNYYLKKVISNNIVRQLKEQINTIDHFIPIFPYLRLRKLTQDKGLIDTPRLFCRHLYRSIKSIEYIGPFREPPHRTYMYSGESPSSVGVRGERAMDIMTMDFLKQRGSKKKKFIIENVQKFFKLSQISDEIRIHKLSDRHFEIVLSKYKARSEDNIADVGYGCSQILPILIAGYNIKEKNILIVEEPEIHLHPKAQAELGTFFYELSEREIQTIIETHSEHLLLRLQAYIADPSYNLKPDDLRIYYVYMEKGKRRIVHLELDDNGLFKTEWPEGFFPERYFEARKIAQKVVTKDKNE